MENKEEEEESNGMLALKTIAGFIVVAYCIYILST
tara:strand:+ start:132 stop:236 length:105 start_codon:yes stop_codon:yes gene_type:complete